MRKTDNTLTALFETAASADAQRHRQQQIFARLGLGPESFRQIDQLPFAPADLTAGTENELNSVVLGDRRVVDLPLAIDALPFSQTPGKATAALQAWLADNAGNVWEHSWVRFSVDRLNAVSRNLLDSDLGARSDRGQFINPDGTLRLPASYVLKLALADVLGRLPASAPVQRTGRRVLGCFMNDNTAPEIISTHIVSASGSEGLGQAVARENAQRFLLTQLLTALANNRFGLREHGQELAVFSAPNPPQRLRRLSALLPADAYRELFMNPCLSGFKDGVAKRAYMHHCHETLSHSRMHVGARLQEAGLGRPRVVAPMVCDTSLLNNGTHLSLGSRRLSQRFREAPTANAAGDEKYVGDLASKIVEHFLPFFVGLYSAAPARLAPGELRAEQALGFLAHELHGTQLRQLWHGWKRKAGLLAGLQGDYVPDQRLLDYFAALPGTVANPAFDGSLGSPERLKGELAARGLFSERMTFYTLYRLREQAKMGFSGFEGRHYSLFAGFREDMAPAAELQALVTAMAYRLMAAGHLTHAHIPDDPETESERRQIFFASAAGLPSFYVRRDSRNFFLHQLLKDTRRTRASKRYAGYLKVYLDDYRAALFQLLARDAVAVDAGGVLADLSGRLRAPQERGVAGRVTRAILDELGAKHPLDVDSRSFGQASEHYYRDRLRQSQTEEGLQMASDSLQRLERLAMQDPELQQALRLVTAGQGADRIVAQARDSLRGGAPDMRAIEALIGLLLLDVAQQEKQYSGINQTGGWEESEHASVC